jgi:hypothetical protein
MLCELTPVLAEASKTVLEASTDMTCAGDQPLAQVEHDVTSGRFDALLLGATVPAAAEPSRRLLVANPQLKIVCIAPDGREAVLQERRLDRIQIENVSFELIFAALRDSCAAEKVG